MDGVRQFRGIAVTTGTVAVKIARKTAENFAAGVGRLTARARPPALAGRGYTYGSTVRSLPRNRDVGVSLIKRRADQISRPRTEPKQAKSWGISGGICTQPNSLES
jgi:hypothetical protein